MGSDISCKVTATGSSMCVFGIGVNKGDKIGICYCQWKVTRQISHDSEPKRVPIFPVELRCNGDRDPRAKLLFNTPDTDTPDFRGISVH